MPRRVVSFAISPTSLGTGRRSRSRAGRRRPSRRGRAGRCRCRRSRCGTSCSATPAPRCRPGPAARSLRAARAARWRRCRRSRRSGPSHPWRPSHRWHPWRRSLQPARRGRWRPWRGPGRPGGARRARRALRGPAGPGVPATFSAISASPWLQRSRAPITYSVPLPCLMQALRAPFAGTGTRRRRPCRRRARRGPRPLPPGKTPPRRAGSPARAVGRRIASITPSGEYRLSLVPAAARKSRPRVRCRRGRRRGRAVDGRRLLGQSRARRMGGDPALARARARALRRRAATPPTTAWS